MFQRITSLILTSLVLTAEVPAIAEPAAQARIAAISGVHTPHQGFALADE